MSATIDNEFDSGDDLFQDIAEDDLIQKPAAKRENPSNPVNALYSIKKPRLSFSQTQPKDTHQDAAFDKNAASSIAQNILKQKFGYKGFRHEQKAAIDRILKGQNSLVIFPTGAGKSLCYQVSQSYHLFSHDTSNKPVDPCHRL